MASNPSDLLRAVAIDPERVKVQGTGKQHKERARVEKESTQSHDVIIKQRLQELREKKYWYIRKPVHYFLMTAFWTAILAPFVASVASFYYFQPGTWTLIPVCFWLLFGLWVVDQFRIFSSPVVTAEEAARISAATPKKRVCVIGAGPAGLCTVKELLAEGHKPVCYDRLDRVGGSWVLNDGQFCVPGYTTMVSSLAVTAFSDFHPQPFPHRMSTRGEYQEYLQAYADHFDLLPHINFQHTIESIEPINDGEQWCVTVSHNGQSKVEIFDKIASAAGLHTTSAIPPIRGLDKYKAGKVIPFSDVKGADMVVGKRVVVVGFGEAAADLSYHAAKLSGKQCYLSIARGKLVVPRYNPNNGLPNDYDTTRLRYSIPTVLRDFCFGASRQLCAWSYKSDASCMVRGYCLDIAPVGSTSAAATKSADFIHEIIADRLKLKPFVDHFTETEVVFKDGSSCEADLVVFCTGFEVAMPFVTLPEGVDTVEAPALLYKSCLHPAMGDKMAMIGYVRPHLGAIPPIAELQARWYAGLLSGYFKLPDQAAMRQDIQVCADNTKRCFKAKRFPHFIIEYVPYLDMIAELVGCRPRLMQLLTQPRLLFATMFGPIVVAQYRLSGIGACPAKAKKFIRSLPQTWTLDECLAYTIFHFYGWCLSLVGFKKMQPSSTAL